MTDKERELQDQINALRALVRQALARGRFSADDRYAIEYMLDQPRCGG